MKEEGKLVCTLDCSSSMQDIEGEGDMGEEHQSTASKVLENLLLSFYATFPPTHM